MRALIYFLTKKTLETFNKSSPNKPNAVLYPVSMPLFFD